MATIATDGHARGVGAVYADSDALKALADVTARVLRRDLEDVEELDLLVELEILGRVRNQLDARKSAAIAELTRRKKDDARARHPNNPRAGEQAARHARQQLVGELHLSHGEVKQAQQIGAKLAQTPRAREAFEAGTLPTRHAQVLVDALQHVADPEVRARLEHELTEAGQAMNPTEFGRLVRQRLGELDDGASVEAQQRRNQRRTGRLSQSPDGFQELHVRVSGVAGEMLATAVHAFRRTDAEGEHRTPEQATADAVVAMAEAALGAAKAPLQHGIRPHLTITLTQADLDRGSGLAKTVWSGPVPIAEVEPLYDDCSVSRLILDARGVPVEASEAVRSVPAGVWRAVVERDGGCIADGCDQPPQWCQVMHLGERYRFGGRLTIPTAGLGCSYHHKKFDLYGWKLSWFEGRPVLHAPDKPPRRSRPPDTRGDPP
ncbi:DUF222 domain-containing protein [Egicoccus sp. AB-alg6-2]|uniref:DUF222 domain-containing protein n=1 Tax=Egicoccus sp. AB-alg6-2 TaxID=3242692 RepID=UPI00359DCEE3